MRFFLTIESCLFGGAPKKESKMQKSQAFHCKSFGEGQRSHWFFWGGESTLANLSHSRDHFS